MGGFVRGVSSAVSQPLVRVFSGNTGALVHQFLAYAGTFRGGVRVAAVDFGNNGQVDILVGPGAGMRPRVRVLNGQTYAQVSMFDAFVTTFTGGVFVG
jgi:hypothetical protein